MAIRSALGAGRGPIVRQFLLETCPDVIGAALGLAVAWGRAAVTISTCKMLPQSLPASLDWRVPDSPSHGTRDRCIIVVIPVFHILRTNLAACLQSIRAAVVEPRRARG